MSYDDDGPFDPQPTNVREVIAALETQARWRKDQERIEASLSDREKALRAKFAKALGPDGPLELAGFDVADPTSMLVYAEAYRRAGREAVWALGPKAKMKEQRAAEEPYKVAMFFCVAIWLGLRGHKGALEMLSVPRSMPPLPPVPKDWRTYRPAIYEAMGIAWVEPDNVVPLRR